MTVVEIESEKEKLFVLNFVISGPKRGVYTAVPLSLANERQPELSGFGRTESAAVKMAIKEWLR